MNQTEGLMTDSNEVEKEGTGGKRNISRRFESTPRQTGEYIENCLRTSFFRLYPYY